MLYKKLKAFTLIELLVVIAIIGILSTLVIISLGDSRASARDAKRLNDLKAMANALELYYADNNSYPEADNFSPGQALEAGGVVYMSKVPNNPTPRTDGDCQDNEYIYESNTTTYTIYACIGSDAGFLLAGNIVATPAGITSPNEFIILVKTDNAGTSTSTQFTIPTTGAGYNYNVDWGDGNASTGLTGDYTHTYASAGTYKIKISGNFPRIYFNNGGDRLKLLEVQNWGNIAWTSMQSAFHGAANMDITATDIPDLSNVTNMEQMIRGCNSLVGNSSFSRWDTSNITNMGFNWYTPLFNQDIGDWDVSNVTNMQESFRFATAFNQDIGNWNVSKVSAFSNFMAGKTAANYSAEHLDSIYNGWIRNPLITGRSIQFGTIKYTAAGAEGRALLTRANATVNVSNVANNGSGLIRVTTSTSHGLTTNNKIFNANIGGTTEANGLWVVTVINATTIDLQGSTFTNSYTSGGTVRTGYGWTVQDGGI
ncbi:MAG: BspA family leucine-rich repeat surface protein [Patescibacteria group bacterium]|nr:MAG: BspA family leucine-rich repeat surface protein [Patescibacteria group bacterium]